MRFKTLYQCYKKPSKAKERIYNICIQKALKDNAVEYGIISYNAQFITFAYRKPDNEVVIIKPSKFYSICRDVI